MKKIIYGLLVLTVLSFGGFFAFKIINGESLRYVTIDINPSVELVVNEQNEVIDVLALNEDGEILISDLDLISKTAEEATRIIVDEAAEAGYLTDYDVDNEITITVYDEEDEENELGEKLRTDIQTRLDEKGIYAVVMKNILTEEVKAEADELGISNGKMLLIQKAILVNPELTVAELQDKEISEIQDKIAETRKEARQKALELKNEAKNSYNELREEYKNMKAELMTEAKTLREKFQSEIAEQSGLEDDQIDSDEISNLIEERKAALKDIVEEKRALYKESYKEYIERYKSEDDSVSNDGTVVPDDNTNNEGSSEGSNGETEPSEGTE